jgi:hypothetical protein
VEKRSCKRRWIHVSIVCSDSGSLTDGNAINGTMKNCCSTGFYAELAAHVKAGTVLVVRAVGGFWGISVGDGGRPSALAEVKWSEPNSFQGKGICPTGLRYLTAWPGCSPPVRPPQPTIRNTATRKEKTP